MRELLDEQLTLVRDEAAAGLRVETVQPGRFTGQVIHDGERIVCASLPVTKRWLVDHKWQTAKPFELVTLKVRRPWFDRSNRERFKSCSERINSQRTTDQPYGRHKGAYFLIEDFGRLSDRASRDESIGAI